MPTARLEIVDAFASGLTAEAAALAFEYMAATCAEVGWPVPARPSELPEPLRSEVADLPASYRSPGTFVVARRGGEVVGGVGMQVRGPAEAEVKRLYVRAEHRGGVARPLMEHLHATARRAAIRRLVLDVLPQRVRVIDLYRSLGYTETEPYAEEPVPMVFLALNLPASPPQT